MKKKVIIYAVNSGEYSDYRVDALFSTKQKAKDFMVTFPGGDFYGGYNDLKQYELDPPFVAMIQQGYERYSILMLRNGDTERVAKQEERNRYEAIPDTYHVWRRSQALAYRGEGIPDVLDADVWAKSEKHALKIVNEIRTRLIAEGKWK